MSEAQIEVELNLPSTHTPLHFNGCGSTGLDKIERILVQCVVDAQQQSLLSVRVVPRKWDRLPGSDLCNEGCAGRYGLCQG